MAIKYIGSAWKENLRTGFPPEDRIYLDFRKIKYPPVRTVGTEAYTLATSSVNFPGTYAGAFSGTEGFEYFLDMTSKFSIIIEHKPGFVYTSATDHVIKAWYVSATQKFLVRYDAATDTFVVEWQDGGTARTLSSQQFDDGTSFTDIDQRLRFIISIDLTTGTTAGSSFTVEPMESGSSATDSTWSGNIDSLSTNFSKMSTGFANDTDYYNGDMYYERICLNQNLTTLALWKATKAEEIYFPFDGHMTGNTRVNVTRFMSTLGMSKNVEHPTSGAIGANNCTFRLNSQSGEFADDQYATYDPTLDQFNGTVAQKYLQQRSGIYIENWYDGDFDSIFVGQFDDSKYSRSTPLKDIQRVSCRGLDNAAVLMRKQFREAQRYDNYKLSSTTFESSLFHQIAYEGTKEKVRNYAANSGFENAAIGSSWFTIGTASIARSSSQALLGTYSGSATFAAGSDEVYQEIRFDDVEVLNPDENYTFTVYGLSAGAFSGTLKIEERDSGGVNDSSTSSISLSGGEDFKSFTVTHQITDSDSDRLRISVVASTGTIFLDCAMLTETKRQLNYFVLNTTVGNGTYIEADDYATDSFAVMGINAETVDFTHPWLFIEEGERVWDNLTAIGDASAPRYMGLDAAGVLTLKAVLSTAGEPTSLFDVDEHMGNINVNANIATANRIIISGVYIQELTDVTLIFQATGSSLADVNETDIQIAVLNNELFPLPSTFGDFWAKYGEGLPEPSARPTSHGTGGSGGR